jgi:hypothetical protein
MWRVYQYCLDMSWHGQMQQNVLAEFTANATGELHSIHEFIPELRDLADTARKALIEDYLPDEPIENSNAKKN